MWKLCYIILRTPFGSRKFNFDSVTNEISFLIKFLRQKVSSETWKSLKNAQAISVSFSGTGFYIFPEIGYTRQDAFYFSLPTPSTFWSFSKKCILKEVKCEIKSTHSSLSVFLHYKIEKVRFFSRVYYKFHSANYEGRVGRLISHLTFLKIRFLVKLQKSGGVAKLR